MMKNYKLTVFILVYTVFATAYGQSVTFNVDLNRAAYPETGKELRIGGNANGTGWTSSLVLLSDLDNDGIYSGSADFPVGDFLFIELQA
ncbi:hypothetical protein [Flavivirga jejuensis]|uniref:Uncharacterized protein n=1 Tax=Flavivirga jejuensis TaxID=870487 RepID=A0ABT8WVQ1_9FLAO|nr:hypothetical protein [Flavivirga jejuensis]MDO5976976.1 hypothetical protein [Flavivirga jejuensis]